MVSDGTSRGVVVRRRRGLRARVDQLRWTARDRYWPGPRAERRSVAAGMSLRAPRLRSRRVGSVWAVTMVRDELDVLPAVIDHLEAQGVDGIVVADNMSADGTWEYLTQRAQRDARLVVGRDRTFAYLQARKMTYLSEVASRAGADWIIPFDADEFWFAPQGRLAPWLRSLDSDVVEADWLDMVLLGQQPVTRRSLFLLDSMPSEFPKVAFRSLRGAHVLVGNHGVRRVGERSSRRLKIAHARWRSAEQVARKVRQGTAAMDAAGGTTYGVHWRKAAAEGDEAIASMWHNLVSGRPEGRLDWPAHGPMLEVQAAGWELWNPDGLGDLS